jgi:hypothetical protein
MNEELDLKEMVSVTLPVSDWAEVVAAVGTSQACTITTKERVNATIFTCVASTKRTLS